MAHNHQIHGIPNLQMLTFLNGQQFVQQNGQSMYTLVNPGQHQVIQNVQHVNQFNNQFHPMQQQYNQQIQQGNIHLQLQTQQHQQLTQQIQATQQIQQQQQQQNHQIQQQHQPVQQHQPQTPMNVKTKGKGKGKNNNANANNIIKDEDQIKTKSGKKKKQIVVNKDGVAAPKRATTAYINFTQYYREQMKKSGRTIPKIGEFGKECAAKWNSMTEEEKKPFTDEAERDRERYRKEMEIFKPVKDSLKPKRPGTAFMLFMVDFRKEIAGKEPEGGVAAVAKLGGERWRGMTDEEKKPYVDQQSEQKQQYEKRMEEYRQQTGQPTPANKSTNNTSKANSTSVKSEDSNVSEHLNNSLSNSNISNNVDQLNNHDEHQSPGSTSPQTANNLAQMSSPDVQTSLQPISLQSQAFYTQGNTFMPNAFLDQHEDASYSQTIDQQIHDGQNQEQNDQNIYTHNGQAYHYGWS